MPGSESPADGVAAERARFDASGVFVHIAEEAAKFHLMRGEGFERKAIGVLGFDGVLVALLPALTVRVGALPSPWQGISIGLAVTVVTLLVISAVFAVSVLRVGKVNYPATDELTRLFNRYLHQVDDRSEKAAEGTVSTPQEIEMAWAKALLDRKSEGKEPNPVESFKDDADKRGKQFGWAVRSLSLAVVVLAVPVAIILIGGSNV